MKITINKEELIIMLEALIDNIGCGECPLYEECEGCSCSRSCAEFFIEHLNS